LLPQAVQRARCRSRSLDAPAPHRMTGTAQANGAWCWHFSQQSQTHGVASLSLAQGRDRAASLHRASLTPMQKSLQTSWQKTLVVQRCFWLISLMQKSLVFGI